MFGRRDDSHFSSGTSRPFLDVISVFDSLFLPGERTQKFVVIKERIRVYYTRRLIRNTTWTVRIQSFFLSWSEVSWTASIESDQMRIQGRSMVSEWANDSYIKSRMQLCHQTLNVYIFGMQEHSGGRLTAFRFSSNWRGQLCLAFKCAKWRHQQKDFKLRHRSSSGLRITFSVM